jgi:membrane-bound serine protease (ClpP class)
MLFVKRPSLPTTMAAAWATLLSFLSLPLAAYADAPRQPKAEANAVAKGDVPAANGDQPRARRQGIWIRIQLPIDNTTVLQTQQTIQRALGDNKGARPVFVLDFNARDVNNAGQGTQFEDAHRLARFLTSDELNGASKVAFIPKALYGHAVLVALACDQIVMGADAKMGDAGCDEKEISQTLVSAYREVASKRRNLSPQAALGLLDKSREVFKVTTEAGIEYADAARLAELNRAHRVLDQERIKAPGEAWQFSGSEGRKLGFVSVLAEDQSDVVRALELSPDIIQGDPSGGNPWHAVRINIRGPIHPGQVEDAQQTIEKQMNEGVNFICISIDSPGGSPSESWRLANYLLNLDHSKVRTVAYIGTEARGDAAMIAMGCDQLVMEPRAVLGGPGAGQMTFFQIARYRSSISDALSRRNLRSWSLWAAMFDPTLEVFRCTRMGDVDYFCDDELKTRQPQNNQGDKGTQWRKGEVVHPGGGELTLDGKRALELGIARNVVNNFDQFKQLYGLENDPTLAEPGWVVHLARFLSTQEIATLLLVVGIIGLYIELHAPGIGIGAFVSIVCFALFFWSHYLEGTAGWLQITLFVTGVLCVLVELTLFPGLMVFGLGGGALIVLSVVLAGQTYWIPRNEYQLAQLERTLISLSVAIVATVAAAVVLNRWLPRAPLFQHVFLTPPDGEEAEIISRREMLANFDNLVGAVGVSSTQLGPSGKAMFGNHLVDCISSGEFIPRDTQVTVIEVRGNRVVVRAVDS